MQIIDAYDVLVVGSGPGGMGAAVAAGRAGAKTLLIEREGCLGGGMTTSLITPFMPWCTYPGPAGEPPKRLNGGLFREISERLAQKRAATIGWVTPFHDETMKLVLDEFAAESGARVLFHAALCGVEMQGDRLQAVYLAHNGGLLRATAKVFIDATGDAVLTAQAGGTFRFGNEKGRVMASTLTFIVAGVDTDHMPGDRELRDAIANGHLDSPALINQNLSGYTVTAPGMVHFNAIRLPIDPLDPLELSDAEMEGRRRVDNFVAWLRAKFPAFQNGFLAKTGNHLGVRETRRIVGDYTLIFEDFMACAKFDDGIACCSYPVDIHGEKPGEVTMIYPPAGGYYQIPYRCLTPRGIQNLLVAARSISVDIRVHGSMRIMPAVMNIGEAAGFAAAMSLPEGNVRKIDVQELRRRIVANGGILEPTEEMLGLI